MRNALQLSSPLPAVLLLVVIVSAFLLAFSPTPSCAEVDNAYLNLLLRRATELKLHEDRGWKTLLHYSKSYRGVERSRIGDEKFFLSPDGKTDSAAELEATLRSFFVPAAKDGEHTSCRLPARFEWLKGKLDIDTSRLPPFTCSERDKTITLVDAKSAVLVFPVGHTNSPASMFGHTLLRIDSSRKSRLLSYAANYAAGTTDTNGFLYAYRGLTGGYPGYYSMMPYYEKTKEYNDLEHRDMWEYTLRLSEDEVKMMMNHLWELQTMSSPYYFLDENCSYNLLFVIEAARPQIHLTDRTGFFFVLPTDTIRVAKESGILDEPHYRPSQGTRIHAILSVMDLKDRKSAYTLAHGEGNPEALLQDGDVSNAEKMRMLDVAAEYVQVRYARDELDKDEYSKLYLKLLRARSKLGTPPVELYEIKEPSRPESGHRTSKVAVGAGVRRGEPVVELEAQPAFHGLLDPDIGYIRGAQIEFFNTALLYNAKTEDVRLKRVHLVDIISLAPRDTFFKSLSWKVAFGADREAMRNGQDALVFRLNTGGGYTYSSPWDGIIYGLGEADLVAGGKVRAGVSLAPGISVGILEQLTEWWKVHLFARGFLYRLGDHRDTVTFGAGQNFRVNQNNSITTQYSRQYMNSNVIEEAGLLWNHYF
ncbi:DUF4105 domain-containing protein [Geomonas sp. RF6]|uniref:Lnb N-terminal periplasmic domain-containing protein n=1 Tax=Geomonas sp. RF6 TaxID=2897342 RepID=UPI001E4973D2|nr:DUF4105 domain-containing protein [Geomonas sp. RF6]UFS71753.1 DUF4105 domain-containing protein [Geomonas sp. RF6]